MYSLIQIAVRNVLRNRRRSLLTLSAVFLSVGIMVGVRGMMNGMHSMIREGVIFGQTGAVQVHKKGYLKLIQSSPLELNFPIDQAFLDKIAATPGVTAVAPRISFGGMANDNDTTVFALFHGLDPVNEIKVCPRRWEQLNEGKGLDPAVPTGSTFSDELIRRLGTKMGGTTALLSGDHDGVMNAVEVKLTGQFRMSGIPLPDKKIAFIPLASAQELLRLEGRATEVALSVTELDKVDEVAARLRTLLGPEFEVSTWSEVATFVQDIINNQNATIGIILDIFFFIALIGIANTMLMNVLERTREIGTMMAIGLHRRQILTLFLLEAALLGLAGGLTGAAVGTAWVYHFGAAGMRIKPAGADISLVLHPFVTASFIAWTFLLAAGGAAGAALYPSWWASRLRPIEALSRT